MSDTQFNPLISRTLPPQLASQALIDMFSLTPSAAVPVLDATATDHRALWTSDALHRANNLAQMASSLGSERVRRSHGLHAGDAADGARALSLAYAELGDREPADRPVPCAPMLETIATGLVALFSGEAPVDLRFSLDSVELPSEQRRALVLIASELVINALKHAFPSSGGGTITVMLVRHGEAIELHVADDGVGFVPRTAAGEGSGLIRRFAALLGADIEYRNERGINTVVSIPRAVFDQNAS